MKNKEDEICLYNKKNYKKWKTRKSIAGYFQAKKNDMLNFPRQGIAILFAALFPCACQEKKFAAYLQEYY